MDTCRSPMSIVPVRLIGSALADTRYATVPSPCPFAEDVKAIHDDCVVAVHGQSRSTTTDTVPLPPPGSNDDVGVDTSG